MIHLLCSSSEGVIFAPGPIESGLHGRGTVNSYDEHYKMEARLLGAVVHAKIEYEESKKEFEIAKQRSEDVGLQHADGCLSLSQAVRKQRITFRHYMEALRRFNRFILDKKHP